MAMATSAVGYHADEEDDIPEHLQCPVCFNLPEKEAYQCKDSHVVCSDCYNNEALEKCPICRFEYKKAPKIRNRYFEAQAAEYVKVDCTFKTNGCKQRIRRGLLKDHEQGCHFNFKKFGNLVNLCKDMNLDCNFQFNNGNVEDTVAHFVSAHGAMVTKAEHFQMEIPSFKEDINIQPTSGDFQFWRPVIVELPEKNSYILSAGVRNVKEDSFKCLSLLLPRFNASLSKPSDLKMECSLIDESKNEPLKLSIVQDLTSVDEFLQERQGLRGLFKEGCRQFEISEVKNFIKKDGSLLIGCGLMKGKDLEKDSWKGICKTVVPYLARAKKPSKFASVGVRWNASNGSLAAKKYLKDLKAEITLSPYNPKALETIRTICNGVNYKNNQFWKMFDNEMSMHIYYGALFIVTSSGTVESLERMLSLRLLILNANIVDEIGKSLLHYTMDDKNHHRGLMKAKCLLAAGANIRALDDNQRSLLHWTACSGNAKALTYFIHRGLDVDAEDGDGRTPLHYALMNATEWGTRNVVEVLMDNGASECAKDKLGWTPLDYLGEVKGSMSGKMIDEIMKLFKVAPLNNRGITSSWRNDKANDDDDSWGEIFSERILKSKTFRV